LRESSLEARVQTLAQELGQTGATERQFTGRISILKSELQEISGFLEQKSELGQHV
jgi:hypothetical protein